jgi:lipid-A-disaccharide synthase-like uncharacterized protein
MYYLMSLLNVDTPRELAWVTFGLFGQLMFTMRFIVQWLASEKAGHSVVPIAFWYFSIIGGLIVLSYGIYKFEPVIILGQLPGCLIYSRNLFLIYRDRRRERGL